MIRIILLLISFNFYGIDISVDGPNSPVGVGEVFDVSIKVSSPSKPEVNFNLENLELVAQKEEGYSSNITIINGKMTKTQGHNFRYTFKALKVGKAEIKNLHAVAGSETELYKGAIIYEVVKDQKQDENIFAIAVPNKKSVYLGEQVILKYYLYRRVQIIDYNILKFPKLNDFFNRFSKEPQTKSKVTYKGKQYERFVLYAGAVYPSVLNAKIDPIISEVTYPVRSSKSRFGGFGFGFSDKRKKTYASEELILDVMNLPAEGRDDSFTGLVGDHKIEFSINKEKVLVNEPIEIKFSIRGRGNLETYKAPVLLNEDRFESFESSSKIDIYRNYEATKTFNLTYLPKFNAEVEARKIPLSFFDPAKKKYITKYIEMPKIIVRGGSELIAANNENIAQNIIKLNPQSIVGPFLSNSNSWFSDLHKIFNVLLGICLMLSSVWVLGGFVYFGSFFENNELQKIKKSNLSYPLVYRYLDQLESGSETAVEKVKSSTLSEEAKSYFVKVLQSKSNANYSAQKEQSRMTFEKKYFNEVERIIKKDEEHDETEIIKGPTSRA